MNKLRLTSFLALAFLLALGGQAFAQNLVVNGDFALYKPGTGYTVSAMLVPGNSWASGVGDNRTVNGGGVTYADDPTNTPAFLADIPGWTGNAVSAWGGAPTNGVDIFHGSPAFAPDGTSSLNAFGTWSGGNGSGGHNGSLVESDAPLAVPTNRAGLTLDLSAQVIGDPQPRTFDLLVDGVVLAADSFVDPPVDTGNWQLISKTYSNIPAGDVTLLIGTSRSENPLTAEFPALTGTRLRFDNISLIATQVAVPEPASVAIWSLLGLGIACFGYYRFRRKK